MTRPVGLRDPTTLIDRPRLAGEQTVPRGYLKGLSAKICGGARRAGLRPYPPTWTGPPLTGEETWLRNF